MPAAKQLLAFDLGAESGRGVLGKFDGNQLTLDVVHRFPNGGVRIRDGLYWDILRLFEEMKNTLRIAAGRHGRLDSLGIDTWGVDFALLGRGDDLLGNPRHYRDALTEGVLDEVFAHLPREEIFRQTGIQFMRFNSLFQLVALKRDHSPLLETAKSLLFIPDLLHFWFTGIKCNELTIASTSQFYDPVSQSWAFALFERCGLPTDILGRIAQPGAELGQLLPSVMAETNQPAVPVILPASHDTGSAVAAVPATGDSWCYISSGTWSLMGAEISRPIIDERSLHFNFTNEVGVRGTIRFLKNIMGLWLVQECRRSWERAGQSYGYDELMRLAQRAPALVSIVDPDDSSFHLPSSMPSAIADFCQRTGQAVPRDPGAIVRCALESLALRYRWVLERLEEMLGRRLEVIHIVGGGSQNLLLNQLAADACNRVVLSGPVEATAIGNVLVQAIGLGLIGSLAEARQVVSRSFQLQRFEPENSERWNDPYARFVQLFKRG
jgi:rhamnulokinase